MKSQKEVVVVGAGFAGLSGAAYLARQGFRVTLVEKNEEIGGRARIWNAGDYTFDMGPSWYLMPEVFDRFFSDIGKDRSDYYQLTKLDPSYRVFFENHKPVDISPNLEKTKRAFADLETQGDQKLESYLKQAEYKYSVAIKEFLYKEYTSVFDFLNKRMLTEGLKLNVFQNLDKYVRKTFNSVEARQILEYAMVFLGTSPEDAPALYSLMSHVDMNLGVYFPTGGLGGVALGMLKAVQELGVEVLTNTEVTGYQMSGYGIVGVQTTNGTIPADAVLFTGDYHHGEVDLLQDNSRSISIKKWNSMVLAPSMFILYLGVKKPLTKLAHHNLYFRHDWDVHFNSIFKDPDWPQNPCFYLSCISKTETGFAPQGKENVFVLVPTAPGLYDSDEVREEYTDTLLKHIEVSTGEEISEHIELKRIFTQRDFSEDYNAWQGTALGIAHTLGQTAVFRPGIKSKKIRNLFYSGQFTHPGVGVPMVLIASKLGAARIERELHG